MGSGLQLAFKFTPKGVQVWALCKHFWSDEYSAVHIIRPHVFHHAISFAWEQHRHTRFCSAPDSWQLTLCWQQPTTTTCEWSLNEPTLWHTHSTCVIAVDRCCHLGAQKNEVSNCVCLYVRQAAYTKQWWNWQCTNWYAKICIAEHSPQFCCVKSTEQCRMRFRLTQKHHNIKYECLTCIFWETMMNASKL